MYPSKIRVTAFDIERNKAVEGEKKGQTKLETREQHVVSLGLGAGGKLGLKISKQNKKVSHWLGNLEKIELPEGQRGEQT